MRHNTTLNFQFVSDLHTEFPDASDYVESIPKTADNMLLLGDIGNPFQSSYANLLSAFSNDYDNVYVVAGNHEYYRHTYTETNQQIQCICDQYDNVTFLNRTSVDLPESNCTLLGATLWTAIPEIHKPYMRFILNDYNIIYSDAQTKQAITITDTNTWHQQDVAFIEANINKAKRTNKDVIVATHHAPTWEGAINPTELKQGEMMGFVSGTQLDRLFGKPVKAWLFGHTHYSCDFVSNGSRILSNQHGYRDEHAGFDSRKIYTYTP